MVKIDKKKKRLLIKIYILVVALLILFFFIPLPYLMILPGGFVDLGNVVFVSNAENTDREHFYAVSAKIYYNPYAKILGLANNNFNSNLFALIIAKLSSRAKILKATNGYSDINNEQIEDYYSNLTEKSNKIAKELAFKYLEINNSEINLSIAPLSGSSGGLMVSLEIINQLDAEDIIKGRKIAGTGELDKNGSIVSVGGIMQKVYVAEKQKVDILIIPAVDEKSVNRPTRLKIIYANNLTEMIEKLEK